MSVDGIIAAIPTMDRAKREGVRKNAELALADPKRADDARRVLSALDGAIEKETTALAEHVRGLSIGRRVIEAFTLEPMTETEQGLVQVLLDHPGSTSEQLSRALSWGGQAWHLHFGEMCRRREARLWPADRSERRDASFFSGILANLSSDNRWTCKPEVMEAFAALGLKPAK